MVDYLYCRDEMSCVYSKDELYCAHVCAAKVQWMVVSAKVR